MCIALAILSQFVHETATPDEIKEHKSDKNYPSLDIYEYSNSTLNFFTYFLLMSTLIPISLFVSIECKRFLTSRWIEDDSEIYSLIRDKPAKIANSAVLNDLG